MKIIKPSATLVEHNVTPYEFIERVGRTCYKSEDKITEGSAEKFVQSLMKSRHLAMLEHEVIYVVTTKSFIKEFIKENLKHDEHLKFFNITFEDDMGVISGSFRTFYEFFEKKYYGFSIEHLKRILKDLYPLVFGDIEEFSFIRYYQEDVCIVYSREDFIKEFNDNPWILKKHLTHTILFVCDRGVSHEFVRHRPCSFAQESTRYCNYSKDKFGKEITVILPLFFGDRLKNPTQYHTWRVSCEFAEENYFNLLDAGATPQEARSVLPNSLKTELIITATEEEWQHIVNLRYRGTTGSPHPQMKEVMSMAVEDLSRESGGRIEYN